METKGNTMTDTTPEPGQQPPDAAPDERQRIAEIRGTLAAGLLNDELGREYGSDVSFLLARLESLTADNDALRTALSQLVRGVKTGLVQTRHVTNADAALAPPPGDAPATAGNVVQLNNTAKTLCSLCGREITIYDTDAPPMITGNEICPVCRREKTCP
jgi:hypothetical protein